MKIFPEPTFQPDFLKLLARQTPAACAQIKGNASYPWLHGMAYFYSVPQGGMLVEVEVFGLPKKNVQNSSFYGMHIHENGNCTLPFDKTGEHYNPGNQPHPYHAGDLPPLLGNSSYAYSVFYTDRFDADDIIGRSLIIHLNADDFTTQPSGNSGTKIGCGIIFKI
ncbi:MAG: superoxide dismutase family protein [Coprococcus sp.]